jgi:hypothetical protein
MEAREGDLTSKHATGCHSLTKNNERLDWKDEHKGLHVLLAKWVQV